ncbi:hypothetical protein E1301_Tti008616 [Triplophysa tibetana]|uniref:Uncharacterized protein n=1 Tax=Triplophysa tibetana TaxID=1572043 RepID=A0A5A9NU77_9TELE|nr:hypothetical protein E1301_Tti008616 [Triplophysa tibetana]
MGTFVSVDYSACYIWVSTWHSREEREAGEQATPPPIQGSDSSVLQQGTGTNAKCQMERAGRRRLEIQTQDNLACLPGDGPKEEEISPIPEPETRQPSPCCMEHLPKPTVDREHVPARSDESTHEWATELNNDLEPEPQYMSDFWLLPSPLVLSSYYTSYKSPLVPPNSSSSSKFPLVLPAPLPLSLAASPSALDLLASGDTSAYPLNAYAFVSDKLQNHQPQAASGLESVCSRPCFQGLTDQPST